MNDIPLRYRDGIPDDPDIGDCWYDSDLEGARWTDDKPFLATTLEQRGRPPIYVMVPSKERGKQVWCVDNRTIAAGVMGTGWRVTGDITPTGTLNVEPSINISLEDFHGFIRNGRLQW